MTTLYKWKSSFLEEGGADLIPKSSVSSHIRVQIIRESVGAIDSPDRFEHVFDPYYTLEVHEKSFEFDISIVRP